MPFAAVNYKVSMRLPTIDGGMVSKITDIGTPLNASPDCQNVLFDEIGAVRTANGYAKYNAVRIATAPIDGLGTYLDPSGDRVLVAACNGNYYIAAGTTFGVISGSTGIYTAGIDVKIIAVDDKIVFGNGYTQPHKWDGNTFTAFGALPPVNVASATVVSGAAISGTFNWALSYINSAGAESDYYPIISSFAIAGPNAVSITDIPLAPASYGVNAMHLYRTTAAASATYWLVTALSGLQSAVVDNNADASLISAAPLDNGSPPKAKYMVYYRERLFAAGDEAHPYRIYYSNAGAPETWPSTNFIEIEKGDGFYISGLQAFGNAIIIHKNDGHGDGYVYLLYIADSTGQYDDTNWYVFKSPAAFSAISDKSQAFFRNLLFYINRSGAYALSGQDLARTSADSEYGRFSIDNLTYNIDTDVKTWSAGALSKAASVMYDNKIWTAVPAAGSSTNNRIYVYDFVRMSGEQLGVWSKLSAPAVNNFVASDGSLYGGSYDGYVYKIATGSNNDGSAITPYYWTAAISGLTEHRDNAKVFRILYITHECSGNWLLYIDYQVDFQPASTTTLTLSGGGSMWATMQWRNNVWGGGVTTKKSRIILTDAVGKLIKFKFYVTGLNQSFKIKDLELDYNLRSKRG